MRTDKKSKPIYADIKLILQILNEQLDQPQRPDSDYTKAMKTNSYYAPKSKTDKYLSPPSGATVTILRSGYIA